MANGNGDIVSPVIGGYNGGVFVPVIDPVDLPADESVTVIALKSFSDGYVSMFKGEIREISAEKAASYISNEFVAVYVPAVPDVGENDKDKYLHTNAETGAKEWSAVPTELPDVSGSDAGKVLTVNNSGVWVAQTPSSGGGVLVVTVTNGTLDKTWQEIVDAMSTTGAVLAHYDDGSIDNLRTFLNADVDPKSGECTVSTGDGVTNKYTASSASGYPERQA